jgi:hypothetical protein
LSGGNDRLARVVALLDHHLLGQEDLLGRDLHTQVTTSNLGEAGAFDANKMSGANETRAGRAGMLMCNYADE